MPNRTTHRQLALSWLQFFAISGLGVAAALFEWIVIDQRFGLVILVSILIWQVVYSIRHEEAAAELERVDPTLLLDYEDDLE